MPSDSTTCSAEDLEHALAALEGGVPSAADHRVLSTMMLDTPGIRQLAAMDPFSPDHRQGVLDLYLGLRARPDGGYIPERDEAPPAPVPAAAVGVAQLRAERNAVHASTPWRVTKPLRLVERLLGR